MILIADSGATKTDWACIDRASERVQRFQGIGLNPNYLSDEIIVHGIAEALFMGKKEGLSLSKDEVEEVYFYGSGVSKARKKVTENLLTAVFPRARRIVAESDLLGAAKSMLGEKVGFVAILGTGMNTGIYDGKEIVCQIPPLGFVLGDEGSGAYIGRMILRDFLRGDMPTELREKMARMPQMSADEILSRVYSQERPSSYCAGICRELLRLTQHDDQYLRAVVREAFEVFFREIVMKYPDYQRYEFNCVGSAGYIFRDILTEVSLAHSMSVGRIVQAPMDGLITYHHRV